MLPFSLMRRVLVGAFFALCFGGGAAVADFSAPNSNDNHNLSASGLQHSENFAPRWLEVPHRANPFRSVRVAQTANRCPCTGTLDILRTNIPITSSSGTFIRGDYSGVRYENGATATQAGFNVHFWDAASDASGTGSQEIASSASLQKTSVPADKRFIRLRAFSNNIQVTSGWVEARLPVATTLTLNLTAKRLETSPGRFGTVNATAYSDANGDFAGAFSCTHANLCNSNANQCAALSAIRGCFATWDFNDRPYIMIGNMGEFASLYMNGIVSGTVEVDGSAALSGTYTANIGGLRNMMDIAPAAREVSFQWQNNNAGTWENIASATAQTYTYAAADFSGNKDNLRVIVTDAANSALRNKGVPVWGPQMATKAILLTNTLSINWDNMQLYITPHAQGFLHILSDAEGRGLAATSYVGIFCGQGTSQTACPSVRNTAIQTSVSVVVGDGAAHYTFETPYLYLANSRTDTAILIAGPLYLAGLVTGEVSIDGNGVLGGTYTANLSAVENIVGTAPAANEAAYQWQNNDGSGTWENIASATAATYTYAASDYSGGKEGLRVIVSDAADSSLRASSVPVWGPQTVSIELLPPLPGAGEDHHNITLELSNDRIRRAPIGNRPFSNYGSVWASSETARYPGTNASNYVLVTSRWQYAHPVDYVDLSLVRDVWNFSHPYITFDENGSSANEHSQPLYVAGIRTGGTVSLSVPAELRNGSLFSLSVNLTNLVGISPPPAGEVLYRWQQRSGGGEWTDIPDTATSPVYTLNFLNFSSPDRRQLRVIVEDASLRGYRLSEAGFGAVTFTAATLPPASLTLNWERNRVETAPGRLSNGDVTIYADADGNLENANACSVATACNDGRSQCGFLSGLRSCSNGWSFADRPYMVFGAPSGESSSIYVNGIGSGAVSVAGVTASVSGSYTADISGLRNIVGGVPAANEVSFQWQNRDGDNWEDIGGATSQTYDYDSADFTGGKEYLRVIVSDAADSALRSSSVPVWGPQTVAAASPAPAITVSKGGGLITPDRADSSQFSVSYDRADGTETYQWQQNDGDGGDVFTDLRGQTAAVYAPILGELNGPTPRLRAVISQNGAAVEMPEVDVMQLPALRRNRAIDETYIGHLQTMVVNPAVEETADDGAYSYFNIDPNYATEASVTWLGVNGAGATTTINSSVVRSALTVTDPRYGREMVVHDGNMLLDGATWNAAAAQSVAARIEITDSLGGVSTVELAPVHMNAASGGGAYILVVNDGLIQTGATLSIDYRDVGDRNNGTEGVSRGNTSRGGVRWYQQGGSFTCGSDVGCVGEKNHRTDSITLGTGPIRDDVTDNDWGGPAGNHPRAYVWTEIQTVVDALGYVNAYPRPQQYILTGPYRGQTFYNRGGSRIFGEGLAAGETLVADTGLIGPTVTSRRVSNPRQFNYQWQTSPDGTDDSWQNISGATSVNWAINAADLVRRTHLRVLASPVWNTANVRPATARQILLYGGSATVAAPANFAPGAVFTAAYTLTNNNGGTLDTSSVTIQWQQSGTDDTWKNIDGAGGATYTLGFLANRAVLGQSLRAVVAPTLDARVTFIAAAAIPNAAPVGAVSVSIIGGALQSLTAGVVVSGTVNLTDANNGAEAASVTYQWYRGAVTISGATLAVHTVQAEDVAALTANEMSVAVSYTDGLGYSTVYSALADTFVVRASLNLAGATVSAAIIDPDNRGTNLAYQWQRGAAVDGTFADISGAASQTYVVPSEHPAAMPFVRLSLSFQVDGEAGHSFSDPIRVAGIASGAADFTGSGVAAGASYAADLSGLREFIAAYTPGADDVTYQWQTGTSAESKGGWDNIPGATLSAYTLNTGDFNDFRQWMRLSLGDPAGYAPQAGAATLTSRAVHINVPTENGRAAINRQGADTAGAVYTLAASGFTDGNGLDEATAYTYEWSAEVGGVGRDFTGETEAVYTLSAADFAGSGEKVLRAAVTVTDDFGFVTAYTATLALQQPPPAGVLRVTALGYLQGDELSINIGGITDENVISSFAYEWQGSSAENGFWSPLGGGNTAQVYAVPGASEWNANRQWVRAVAEVTDGLADVYTLTAAAILFNQPTSPPTVEIAGGGSPADGATLQVVTAGVSDDNGGSSDYDFTWRSHSGADLGDNRTLEINAAIAADLAAGHSVTAVVVFRDALGFQTTWTFPYPPLMPATLSGALRAVSLAAYTPGATAAADLGGLSATRDDAAVDVAANVLFQWQTSADGSGGGAWNDIGGANSENYVLAAANFNDNAQFLRLRIAPIGGDGSDALFSPAVRINRQTGGGISAFLVDNPAVAQAGITASVNVGGLTDDNNGTNAPSISYVWYNGGNAISGATSQTYVLNAAAATALQDGNLRVTATYTDALGFTSEFAAVVPPAAPVTLRGSPRAVSLVAFAAGATAAANLSGLSATRDGQSVPVAENVNFQWQTSADGSGGGSWNDIGGATSQTYTLAAADFNNDAQFLRLRITPAGNAAVYTPSVRINQPTSRPAVFLVDNPTEATAGMTVSVNSGGLTDANNGTATPQIALQWYNASGSISGATAATQTLTQAEAESLATGGVSVAVTYTDGLGFVSTLVAVAPAASSVVLRGSPRAVSLTAFTAGATAAANLSGLSATRDGAAVPVAENVSYQWQTSANGSTGWTVISGATSQTYTLAAADFNNDNQFLRLQIIPAGNAPVYTPATKIEQQTSRLAAFLVDSPSEAVAGITASVNTAELTDANNGSATPQIAVQWYNTSGSIPGATAATRTLSLAEAESLARRGVSVVVTYTDGLGFVSTLSAVAPPAASVILRGSPRAVSLAAFTAGATAAADLGGLSATRREESVPVAENVSYQWQSSPNGRDNWTNIGGETAAEYVLNASRFTEGAATHLRVQITPTGSDAVVSPAAQIARLPVGNARVASGGELRAGAMVTADISAVTDVNNSGGDNFMSVTYEWLRGGVSAGTTSVIVLMTSDIEGGEGGGLWVRVTLTDGLGYVATLSANFAAENRLHDEQTGRGVEMVFNLLDGEEAAAAIAAHLDAVPERGTAALALEINNIRFTGRQDWARILTSRGDDSINGDKLFAVDSFSLRRGSASGDWSAWLAGGWSAVEGEPILDGKKLPYSGDIFAIYGGYDRDIRGARIGLAAGRTQTELQTDLSGAAGAATDDKVRRELLSLLPYAEFHGDKWRARLVAGIGAGEMEVTEQGGGRCNARADVEWAYASAGGEYDLWRADGFRASAVGDVSRADSTRDEAACGNGPDLPQTNGEGGEWSFGARAGYDFAAGLRPQIGLDARRPFGDISDEMAYDLAGGVRYAPANNGGWSFNLQGKMQLNDTAYRRDAVSGDMRYARGAATAAYRAELEREAGAGFLVHRWELGYAGAWGLNAVTGKAYAERRDNADAAFGVEMLFGF